MKNLFDSSFDSSSSFKDKLKSEASDVKGKILQSFSITKLPSSEKIMSLTRLLIDNSLLLSLFLNLNP